MPPSPGDKLGPYGIIAPIGKGGMGEVWRARDPRVGRDVAIKVSAAQFSERFEREAKAIGALNHPNICTLYDVGPNYLVMEYVEGTPLKGPLQLDQALKYAVQICEALAAAHKKNITHRDLKPANILVTKAGVKLLDFGLAKFVQAAPRAGTPDDATVTMALTGKDEIVGTLYYMSPEQLQAQANGQEIDARSDIFSFGLVFYEMLTGKRAVQGSSPASVIAAIMERPAPSIAEIASPALDRVLQRCLKKDPDDRWQSARDLKAELEWIANESGEASAVHTAVTRQRLLPWMVAAGVLAIAAAGFAFGYYRATRPAELKPLVRLDVDLGPDVWLGSEGGTDAILSPDGTRLVYVSKGNLFTRTLDQPRATELAGTEGAYAPFFSPDGQWVAFFVGGDPSKLKRISVEGGAPVILCDAHLTAGGSWGEDGNIIASLGFSLSRIPSTGGVPTPVTEPAPGERSQVWPQILPGGKAVLFTSMAGSGDANIEVMSLKDRRRKTLQRSGTFGRYLPSGHLVYVNNGTLFAVAFDLDALEVRGTPVPLPAQVAYNPKTGFAQLNFSGVPSGPGMLLYRSAGAAGAELVTVQWLDSEGKTRPLLAKPSRYEQLRLSPDGQRLALEIPAGSTRDIWIYEWQRDTMTRLTFDAGGGWVMNPVWSPDGRYIVFAGKAGIFWIRSDGAGKPQPLTQNKNQQFQIPFSFTPDGKRLSWMDAAGGPALWTIPLESDGTGLRGGKPEVFLQTSFAELTPMFSPDGRWLAYTSNESGTWQIYVRAFPDRGGKWQISNSGGSYPVWSHNGRELFFRSGDNRIMVATYTVRRDSIVVADQPRVWSDKRLVNTGIFVSTGIFDLAPDGKRVATLMPVETPEAQQARNHVVFLINFFDELRRRVPVSGK